MSTTQNQNGATAKRKVLTEMDEQTYQQLRATAKEHERSMAAQIRHLIRCPQK